MAIVEEKKNNRWIWIGVGGAFLFCLCAVAAAVLLFTNVQRQFEQGMKTDPASAAKAAREIADYELPPGYQEESALDFFIYTMVMISDPATPGKPLITLAQFQAGVDKEQMEQQLRQAAEQQGGQRGFTMTVVETKTMTIRGVETEVIIYEGTDQDGDVMRQLITTFPSKDGTAMLMIVGNAQSWDQEEIDTFLESIH
jgi:hypothetical protein